MCKKKNYCGSRIDECIAEKVDNLNKNEVTTLACCCGHGKYPETIIIETPIGEIYELNTFKQLKRPKRNRFYKKDKAGYYYLNPELVI